MDAQPPTRGREIPAQEARRRAHEAGPQLWGRWTLGGPSCVRCSLHCVSPHWRAEVLPGLRPLPPAPVMSGHEHTPAPQRPSRTLRSTAILATAPSPGSTSQVLKEVPQVPASCLDGSVTRLWGHGLIRHRGHGRERPGTASAFPFSRSQSKQNLPSVLLPSPAPGQRLGGREEKVTGHIE